MKLMVFGGGREPTNDEIISVLSRRQQWVRLRENVESRNRRRHLPRARKGKNLAQ